MEFCTRSPNPSTPFLGFVAAASGHVQERIERQLKAQAFLFIPVNCKTQWSLEAELRNGHPGATGRVWRMFLSMGACLRHDSRYIRDDSLSRIYSNLTRRRCILCLPAYSYEIDKFRIPPWNSVNFSIFPCYNLRVEPFRR